MKQQDPGEQSGPSPSAVVPVTFPIWRTILIGGMRSDELIAKLEAARFKIGKWAYDMMERRAFTTTVKSIAVSLVRPTVAELGFQKNMPWEDICNRAESLGLKRCRPEVGPHLRLADHDQLLDEWYWVGMEPIFSSSDLPRIFGVGHSADGLRLDGSPSRLAFDWRLECRLVFDASSE